MMETLTAQASPLSIWVCEASTLPFLGNAF